MLTKDEIKNRIEKLNKGKIKIVSISDEDSFVKYYIKLRKLDAARGNRKKATFEERQLQYKELVKIFDKFRSTYNIEVL